MQQRRGSADVTGFTRAAEFNASDEPEELSKMMYITDEG